MGSLASAFGPKHTRRRQPDMARERIGIMGGTLDPVHMGHIRMAQHAMKAAALDRVLMLPSGNPPHKKDITPTH